MTTKTLITGNKLPVVASAGFSLIELLLVLVISAVAASVVGINFSSGKTLTRLETAANDLVSLLRYANGRALLLQRPVCVDLNIDKKSYGIADQQPVSLDQDIELAVTVGEVDEQNKIAKICFFADSSSTGGQLTLKRHDHFKLIDVNWITGDVRVQTAE